MTKRLNVSCFDPGTLPERPATLLEKFNLIFHKKFIVVDPASPGGDHGVRITYKRMDGAMFIIKTEYLNEAQ